MTRCFDCDVWWDGPDVCWNCGKPGRACKPGAGEEPAWSNPYSPAKAATA